MADLFISYSREDKARAEQVARGLGQAGFDVFWDTEIPPGQTWADFIEAKLSNCSAVVVLWSAHSTKSQWVREEARMGKERGKLIPAMLDDSPPPFGFGEVQAANLSSWTGQQQGHPDWDSLVAAVRSAVGRGGAGPSAAAARPAQAFAPSGAGQTAGAKQGIRPIFIVGGVAVVAAFVVVGVLAMNRGGGASDAPQAAISAPANLAASDVPTGQPTPGAPQIASAPAPPQPSVGGNYAMQLQQQLVQVAQALGSQGFRQVAGPFNGGMPEGESRTFQVTLQAGGDYRIVGVCDNDCPDLDLRLRDQNNVVIAQDTATDSMPVVNSQPAWTGPFFVDVTMYSCTQAPCFFSVVVYGRPRA